MTTDSQKLYLRPAPCPRGTPGSRPLAGGLLAFREVEILTRGTSPRWMALEDVPVDDPSLAATLEALSAPRPGLCEMSMDGPRLMGVLNVTPDSFSDGGFLRDAYAAIDRGLALAAAGADILDIGGESTRPGASPVQQSQELERVLPVIEGLRSAGCKVPVSIDTRNAAVARAALDAGARIFNDVSALTHDAQSLAVAGSADAVCLMHALGDPRTMQKSPSYDDVLLDIYDYLEARIWACEAAGIARSRLIVDPGIGFGKTLAHNLALIRRLSLFHGLGVPVLLGVSRKGFIGALSGEKMAAHRAPGSIAAGLAGLEQGVQILRVHDVAETAQAVAVWRGLQEGTP